MASFEREEAYVRHLLARLGLSDAMTEYPKAAGKETGVDVTVRLADGRIVGVQVTEVDPYPQPGSARGREKAVAMTAAGRPYGVWGQNDPLVALGAIARAITRKVEIAAKHSFEGYDEVWLLLCGGIPEHGAVVSTFVLTPWLSSEDLISARTAFCGSRGMTGCFLLPILGAEQAFYPWGRASRWEKRVGLEDIRHVPREAYVHNLMKAAQSGNWQAVGRLCDEECRKVLAEMRQT